MPFTIQYSVENLSPIPKESNKFSFAVPFVDSESNLGHKI